MLRFKLWIAAVAAFMASVSLAPAALAGGWSIVTSPNFPSEAVAGQEFTIDFTVLQHGVTPLNGLTPLVKLTDAGGETRVFKAVGEGGNGHYVARVVLDRPGTWQCVIEAFEGDHTMPTLRVQPAAASPAGELTTSEATMPVNEVAMPMSEAPIPASESPTTGEATTPWLPVAAAGLLVLSAIVIAVVSRPRWRGHSRHVA